jgi:hypothetical protein
MGNGNVQVNTWLTPEGIALATATAIYSKAFLEALGKRSGDGVADLSKRLVRQPPMGS